MVNKHSIHNGFGSCAKQSGVVLLVSLIMLLLLTLIGSTSMQSASLEERMAGNMRDKNLAFQAAESALSAAEKSLDPPATLPTFVAAGTGGFFTTSATKLAPAATPKITDDSFWIDDATGAKQNWIATSIITTAQLANNISPPHYIIQDLGADFCPGVTSGTPACKNYRIVVRATGGSSDAVVILQSFYMPP